MRLSRACSGSETESWLSPFEGLRRRIECDLVCIDVQYDVQINICSELESHGNAEVRS